MQLFCGPPKRWTIFCDNMINGMKLNCLYTAMYPRILKVVGQVRLSQESDDVTKTYETNYYDCMCMIQKYILVVTSVRYFERCYSTHSTNYNNK